MTQQGLREAILTKHRDKPMVVTYNPNHDCKPIDGIFVTRGITIMAGGYYAFDKTIHSPQRAIWVDTNLDSVFGTKLAPTENTDAQRLKTNDPRVVNKYNKILEKELLHLKLPHGCFCWGAKCRQERSLGPKSWNMRRYTSQRFTVKPTQSRDAVTSMCVGVNWSPKYKAARNLLEVWALLPK
jgi:hypothetical protein